MKVLFLHGWNSTPGGVKPTYLRDHGHTVLNPAVPDEAATAASQPRPSHPPANADETCSRHAAPR